MVEIRTHYEDTIYGTSARVIGPLPELSTLIHIFINQLLESIEDKRNAEDT